MPLCLPICGFTTLNPSCCGHEEKSVSTFLEHAMSSATQMATSPPETSKNVCLCFRLPWWISGKERTCQCRRLGFNPWVGKIPWRRKCNPLQCSCLENPMDRGAWWATVHGVAKSRTGLSSYTLTLSQRIAVSASHPLLPSSPPALNLSQHQGLIQ